MTKRDTILVVAAMLVGMSVCTQSGCASQPGNHGYPANSRGVAMPPIPGEVTPKASSAKAILDRLEKAGLAYTTLRADVDYRVEDRMTGDEELRSGLVAYQKQTANAPAKFRVSFDKLALGSGPARTSKQDYIFDGQWLTIAKHRIKSMTKVQIAAKGEKVEALKIGKGPFPVPFGQQTSEVLKYLEATTSPGPGQGSAGPKGTAYLRLTPKPGHRKDVNFRSLEMWVDQARDLPVKIRSRGAGKKITTVTFRNIKTQATIAPKLFVMPKPPGWDLTIERRK